MRYNIDNKILTDYCRIKPEFCSLLQAALARGYWSGYQPILGCLY